MENFTAIVGGTAVSVIGMIGRNTLKIADTHSL